ncbi:uncharacterized protein LOC130962491 [Arachis stenosperma]|uniref:uncharacterized protein LOC130962491 n=1 Tax=Arachis stenosperma TaxID=217475 RepID=UPI0025AC4030|nr:uncharacterized protein LOC130962491 [Arachis stenosperma]
MTLYDRNNSKFPIAETTPTGSFSLGSYRVSLRAQTCDSEYFQTLHYPCCHALACCAYSHLTWHLYVHQVYRLSSVFSMYQMEFTPPVPEDFWPLHDGPTVIPDPSKRRATEGSPRTTRIRTTMDEADPNRLKRLARQAWVWHDIKLNDVMIYPVVPMEVPKWQDVWKPPITTSAIL